jgi:hypothetical protein
LQRPLRTPAREYVQRCGFERCLTDSIDTTIEALKASVLRGAFGMQ